MMNLICKAAVTILAILGCATLALRAGKPHSAMAANASTVPAPPPAAVALNAPQFGDSQCVSTVPRSWGQYRGGSSQAGLAFEASDGTLRFVTNLPCGAIPVVALEVQRTPGGEGNSIN
jgi:hypothetical protein